MKKVVQTAVMGTVGLLVGATASAGLPSNVIYRNDFTARESAAAIPRLGETYEATPYRTNSGWLHPYLIEVNVKAAAAECLALNGYYGYTSFAASYWINSGDSRPVYDGWFQPNFSTGTAGSWGNLFRHTACLYMDVAADGTSNPCFRFGYNPGTNARRTGIALKSLHNVFTNGQLKIQVDIKVPGKWSANNAQFWVFPVHDKFMSIEAWGGVPTTITNGATLGMFGCRSGGDLTKPYLQYWNAHGNVQFGNNYSGSNRMLWSRYTVTYDLDTGKMTGTCDALNEWLGPDVYTNVTGFSAVAHPTFDTAPNSLKSYTNVGQGYFFLGCASTADLPLIWAERGGISGLGVFVGLVGNAAYEGTNLEGSINAAAINKPLLDNIRVSWKAPGTDEFVVAYEDDFSNRTYRVVSAPNVGTTATYATGTEETGPVYDAFTGYVASNSGTTGDGYNKLDFLGTAVKPYATTLQPVGVDNWRRLIPNSDSPGGRPWVNNNYDSGAGGNIMEIGQSGSYACLAQTLMTNIVSGKVRIVADAHLPNIKVDMNVLGSKRSRMAIGLGTPALYSSVTAEMTPNTLASTGIYREVVDGTEIDEETGVQTAVKLTNDVVFVRDAETTVRSVTLAEGVVIERTKWYRLELVADVEARTYDMSITPLGSLSVGPDFVPTNDVLYAESDIPFYGSNDDGIGTFYLWGYGYGGTPSSSKAWRTCFDNIYVWNIVTNGETTATNLVYSNIFSKRVRMLANTTRSTDCPSDVV